MKQFLNYFVIGLLGQIIGIALLILLIELTGSELLWTLFLTLFVWPSGFLLRLFVGVGETDITFPSLILVILYSLVFAGFWFLKYKLGSHTGA